MSFGVFESAYVDDSQNDKKKKLAQTRLAQAVSAVDRAVGVYLKKSSSKSDFQDRIQLAADDIRSIVGRYLEGETGFQAVVAKLEPHYLKKTASEYLDPGDLNDRGAQNFFEQYADSAGIDTYGGDYDRIWDDIKESVDYDIISDDLDAAIQSGELSSSVGSRLQWDLEDFHGLGSGARFSSKKTSGTVDKLKKSDPQKYNDFMETISPGVVFEPGELDTLYQQWDPENKLYSKRTSATYDDDGIEGFLQFIKDRGYSMPKDLGDPNSDNMQDEVWSFTKGDPGRMEEITRDLEDDWDYLRTSGRRPRKLVGSFYGDDQTGYSVEVENRGGSETGIVRDPNGQEIDTFYPLNGANFDGEYELQEGLEEFIQDLGDDAYQYRRDFHSKKKKAASDAWKYDTNFQHTLIEMYGTTDVNDEMLVDALIAYAGIGAQQQVDLGDEAPEIQHMSSRTRMRRASEGEGVSARPKPELLDDDEDLVEKTSHYRMKRAGEESGPFVDRLEGAPPPGNPDRINYIDERKKHNLEALAQELGLSPGDYEIRNKPFGPTNYYSLAIPIKSAGGKDLEVNVELFGGKTPRVSPKLLLKSPEGFEVSVASGEGDGGIQGSLDEVLGVLNSPSFYQGVLGEDAPPSHPLVEQAPVVDYLETEDVERRMEGLEKMYGPGLQGIANLTPQVDDPQVQKMIDTYVTNSVLGNRLDPFDLGDIRYYFKTIKDYNDPDTLYYGREPYFQQFDSKTMNKAKRALNAVTKSIEKGEVDRLEGVDMSAPTGSPFAIGERFVQDSDLFTGSSSPDTEGEPSEDTGEDVWSDSSSHFEYFVNGEHLEIVDGHTTVLDHEFDSHQEAVEFAQKFKSEGFEDDPLFDKNGDLDEWDNFDTDRFVQELQNGTAGDLWEETWPPPPETPAKNTPSEGGGTSGFAKGDEISGTTSSGEEVSGTLVQMVFGRPKIVTQDGEEVTLTKWSSRGRVSKGRASFTRMRKAGGHKRVAGATDFGTFAKGSSAKDAFSKACREAIEMYGNQGYTGSIAEKDSFEMATNEVVSPDDIPSIVDQVFSRFEDKWGPAGCIELTTGEYFFFGVAST